MLAEEDVWITPEEINSIYKMADIAAEPKSFYVYPGMAHGSGLFFTEFGQEVFDILLDFLIDLSN